MFSYQRSINLEDDSDQISFENLDLQKESQLRKRLSIEVSLENLAKSHRTHVYLQRTSLSSLSILVRLVT